METNGIVSDLEQWQFAGSMRQCNMLFELVKSGVKMATCWLYEGEVDLHEFSVLTNWDKTEKLLLKTTKVEIKKFSEVTEEHAFKEGEGDRTLQHWREVHLKFFKERCLQKGMKFDENTQIVCEEFEVVELNEWKKDCLN